jgi:hypothetical protein
MNNERHLTKHELADVLGVSPDVVKHWASSGTIPPQFFRKYPGAGTNYFYAPIAVAFGELLLELGQLLGGTSKLPRLLIPQAVTAIEAAWQAPDEPRPPLAFCHESAALLLPLTCVARAKHKLETLHAA